MIPSQLTEPYLLVVEGKSDRAFFKELFSARGISGFQIAYPDSHDSGGGGRESFGRLLSAVKLVTGFDQLKALLVVTDCDDNEAASIAIVRDQIGLAGEYGVPAEPLKLAPPPPGAGVPPVVIVMIPWHGGSGNLETLCLPAALHAWPVSAEPLKQYVASTPAGSWGLSKASKARIQCLVAVNCHEDPNTPLAHVWSRGLPCQIPVTHGCFDQIANYLSGFTP